MSLIDELKRRNVFRVSAAYLALGWVTTQVTGAVVPALHLPEAITSMVVWIGVIAFPFVVIFSWVYEFTPEGLKREHEVDRTDSISHLTGRRLDYMTIGIVAIGVVLFAFERFSPRQPEPVPTVAQPPSVPVAASTTETAKPAVAAASDLSIAVLPFVNMSSDPEQGYFSDGISEELLNLLAKLPELRVIARTSSFAFKGKYVDIATVAEKLHVANVLEGSVRKSGNKIRITAQLVRASDSSHLWSETYDRELTDIFAVQDDIANAIVTALHGALGGAEPEHVLTVRADTNNLQAYDLYLKARELFVARTNLKESTRLFEQIVEMDPKFARGWEGLAAVYSILTSWGINDRDYDTMARHAATRALELDATLSMPWAVLAAAEEVNVPVDWSKSLDLFARAIAADPKNSSAYLWRSQAWLFLGFFKNAVADQDRCLALDPAYQNCLRWKAVTLRYAGDIDQALALFEQGIVAGFSDSASENFIVPLLQRGDRIGALLLLNEMGAKPEQRDILMDILSHPDRPHPDAKDLVDAFFSGASEAVTANFSRSRVHMWLGDYDSAANDGDVLYSVSAWDHYPPGFHESAAYKRMLDRLGILAYWRKAGFPPQCRARGDQDFECD